MLISIKISAGVWWGEGGGARVNYFFTKNPNLKKAIKGVGGGWGGGWGSGGGGLEKVIFYKESKSYFFVGGAGVSEFLLQRIQI